jgi:hypothetical protein
VPLATPGITPPSADPPAANPPAAALAIDERFAELAAQFMSQVNATLEAFRTEIQAQFSTNVDPLHKDLHDLLDMQTQAGAKLEKLEAANFVTPEDMQKQIEGLAEHVAQAIAPNIPAPTIPPVVKIADPSVEDRLAKIESKLRFF